MKDYHLPSWNKSPERAPWTPQEKLVSFEGSIYQLSWESICELRQLFNVWEPDSVARKEMREIKLRNKS